MPDDHGYPEFLRDLSLPKLADERLEIAAILGEYQQSLADIQTEITRRYEGLAALALDEAGKDHGTTTRDLDGGYKLKIERKQTVKWDSAALQAVASEMTWERIQHWFKIAFSVPEAKFNAVEPGPFKDELVKARTTKLGNVTVTLIDPKAD